MEVEFLSNMRYSLFVSKEDWEEWHVKLGKFGTYFDRALRPFVDGTPRSAGPAGAPLYTPFSLPSPPASNQASPPFPSAYSPSYRTNLNTPLLLPQISSTTVSPMGPLHELDARTNGRKRSWEDQGQEPPPKRNARSFTQLPHAPNGSGATPYSSYAQTLPRLPLPNIPVPSSQDGYLPALLPPHLPPPGGRAMSLVYPPPFQWPQPSSTSTTAPPLQSASQAHSNVSVGNRSRQISPYPTGSASSSPTNAVFPSSVSHTQNHSRLSPSHFLSQRASPYRPVRSVTTLRMPPPSGSLHDPARHVGYEQMQYQSLGKPATERRAGPLPYTHHDAWPQTNQFNQWHAAPQPISHLLS